MSDQNALPPGLLPVPSGFLPDASLPPGLLPVPSVQNLVSPSGELVGMSPEKVRDALNQGYQIATPEDIAKAERHEKYGTFGQELITGAEAAGSALTFGLAPKAETALGLTTPEDIKGRAEENPIAHGIGTATGIIAPLLLTGGAAAPAEAAGAGASGAVGALRGAAELTAPALIARAGRGAAALAERAGLPSIVGKIAPTLAGAATEGALYATSDVTEKALLGNDPQLTWEHAASEIGLGALFGGALGVGFHGATKGLGWALNKATEGLESIGTKLAKGDEEVINLMMKSKGTIEKLQEVAPGAADAISASTPDTAKFILKHADRIATLEGEFPGLTDVLSRADSDTAGEILNNWNKLLKDPQRRIEVGGALLDATQSTYQSVEDALGKFNREVRPEEAESLLSGPHTVEIPGGGSALELVTPKTAIDEGQKILDRLKFKIEEWKSEPDLFDKGYVRQAELWKEGLERLIDDSMNERPWARNPPADIFQRLRLLRQQFDEAIPWDRDIRGVAERKAVNGFKEIRSLIKNSITDEKVWGHAGTRQGALDKAYADYFAARKEMLSRLGEGTPKRISPTKVNAWVNAMGDMRGKMRTDAFTEYTQAAKNLAKEMKESGLEGGDAILKQIENSAAKAEDIRQRATITQLVKMLQGHEILSSGPAVPMGHSMALAAAKKIPGGAGHILGLVSDISGTIKKVRQPSVMVSVLSQLEKFSNKASKRLNAAADGLFKIGGATGGKLAKANEEINAEHFAHGGMVGGEDFGSVSDSIRHLSSSPDALTDSVSKQLKTLETHAPGTADAARAFAARVVQHLASKLPEPGPRQLLDPPFEPLESERAEFERHQEVASRGPIAVLEHAARGTLHNDHLEASQTLFPKLHAQALQLVAQRLEEHLKAKNEIPHELRSSLGMLLGADLDHANTPQAILSAQKAFADEIQKPGPSGPSLRAGKPRQVQTKFFNRMATPSQRNIAALSKESA